MTYYIDIQNATDKPLPVLETQINSWASFALKEELKEAELTVRIVNPDEMAQLNHTYRKQNKTTNVLSFPSNLPKEIQLECPLLGDIIICPEVLDAECIQLKKSIQEHWALIVIHGVLHLLGYDHISEEDALIMQPIEIRLLSELGYANPYEEEEHHLE